MKHNNKQQISGRNRVRHLVFMVLLACFIPSQVAAFSLESQGYLFLHPFFKARAWKASLNRLNLLMPDDSLAKYKPLAFDVSQGNDSTIAVFTVSGGNLYLMPVRYQQLAAPCFDNSLAFDALQKVGLAGLVLPAGRALYIVKDSLYSFDSLRVIIPSSLAPLKFYIAGIRLSSSSVTKIDSITLTQSRAGQRILGVYGDQDSITLQDRGIWVTGSQGLLRYIPYTNRAWGAIAQRDLADTSTVLHTNGVYAGTMEGRLYKKNTAGTAFVQEGASASKPVWRVYQQGAIGNNGLFKENTNGVWKRDTAFGSLAYRYANFIRRPGGFGVELLDSNWGYKAYTYRDTSSIIQSTVPASLMASINATSYAYPRTGTMNVTINLNDLDSNYSDYRLWLNGTTNLKNDGTYTIDLAAIADTETCHIGTLKMTSSSVRLTLMPDSVKVAHDCVIGALNPTCLSCYWKKYTFTRSVKWLLNDLVILSTATQTLRIVNGMSTVALLKNNNIAESIFRAKFTDANFMLEFPLMTGTHATGIFIHDLKGRLLGSIPVQNWRTVLIPSLNPATGVVIVSCRLSDGSVVSKRIPMVR